MNYAPTYKFRRLVLRNLDAQFRNKLALLLPLVPIVAFIAVYFFAADKYLYTLLESLFPSIQTDEAIDVLTLRDKAFVSNYFVTNLVITVTLTYSMMSAMQRVEDVHYGIINDLQILPVKRPKICMSYVVSNTLFGIIIGLAALIIGMLVLAAVSAFYLSLFDVVYIILCVVATSLLASLFGLVISLFFKNAVLFNSVMTVVSLFIAFAVGGVIPISQFPSPISDIFACLPFTHIAALTRNIVLDANAIFVTQNIDAEIMEEIMLTFGGSLTVSGKTISTSVMIISVISAIFVFAIAFFGIKALSELIKIKTRKAID